MPNEQDGMAEYLRHMEEELLRQRERMIDPPQTFQGIPFWRVSEPQVTAFSTYEVPEGVVNTDWRASWRLENIEIEGPHNTRTRTEFYPYVSTITHKPKDGGVAKFHLPKGIVVEFKGEQFPEFIIVSYGEGYIPAKKWVEAGLSKKRRIKFELSEILDKVYVYKLDKI